MGIKFRDAVNGPGIEFYSFKQSLGFGVLSKIRKGQQVVMLRQDLLQGKALLRT